MNTIKSFKKKHDDLSCTLTTSISRISLEDYSSFQTYDDACSSSSSDDDVDDISSLVNKLERLKRTYHKRKLENTINKRCMEVKKASTFMNDLFLNEELNDSIAEEQRRTIEELYEKNRELVLKVRKVQKLNKTTEKDALRLYKKVQGLMEERKKIWDEATKNHKLNIGDASAFLNFDESDLLNESNCKKKKKDYLIRGIDYAVVTKCFRIMRVARILYNLISNSEVNWSTDKNLLEILNCTSKMLDTDFDLRNRILCTKTVDEVTQRLNKIKI